MTQIAHMPDTAAANGVADDTSALQSMFDACPAGGLCLISDGVYRVTNTVGPRKPMNVWCSPGAHIKGDFSGTQAVVHAFWHTPDGTSDQFVAMESFYWQGGTISRLNRNGPCLRVSAIWAGAIQDVRMFRGSPHLWLDAPDTVGGAYTVGPTSPNFQVTSRAVHCRGYDGGPFGCRVGQQPNYPSSGQSNGPMLDHCYFEGDGSAGSRGIWYTNGGGFLAIGNTIKGYDKGIFSTASTTASTYIATKMINVTDHVHAEGTSGFGNNFTMIHPRGWQGDQSFMNVAARDPQGVYA